MILDSLLTFDTNVNLALAAGTYNSTNIIDLGLVGLPASIAGGGGGGARDIGIGDDPAMKVHVLVTTAFTSGGAATLAVNFQGAPDNGSGGPGTWTTMVSSPTNALANLIAGARLLDVDVPRPVPGQAIPRFLRLTYVVGTTSFTAGQVTSNIVLDRFDQIEGPTQLLSGYPAGITIAN